MKTKSITVTSVKQVPCCERCGNHKDPLYKATLVVAMLTTNDEGDLEDTGEPEVTEAQLCGQCAERPERSFTIQKHKPKTPKDGA